MDNKQNEERSVAVKSDTSIPSLSKVNLLDEKQVALVEAFMKRLSTSNKSGVMSAADGIAILTRAQALNIPFGVCIEHIHVINGKTGIDIHIVKTLLSRAGVTWKCTKDYTPQYKYTDGSNIYNETALPSYCKRCVSRQEAESITNDDVVGVYPVKYYMDLNGAIYDETQINDKCTIVPNKQVAAKAKADGKFPIIRIAAVPIDYVTEYEFTRYKMINGKERIITATSHFSYSEAQTAGFFEKDTYKKYARILIGHRAFTLGARDIASDLLMGCMETTELSIVDSKDLPIDNVIDASFEEV